jgi:hypothetical protein
MTGHADDCTIQGHSGARVVSVEGMAVRIKETFEVLASIGGPNGWPWHVNHADLFDVTDEDAIRAYIVASAVKDDEGQPSAEEGFSPWFYLGESVSLWKPVRDTGYFRVMMPYFSSGIKFSRFFLYIPCKL